MVDEELSSGLTPEQTAYFESGGEKPLEPAAAEQQTDAAAQAAVEGKEAATDRDEKGRFVPHQALHAEREEHKKTRAELAELREFRIRMEERARWADEARQAQQKPVEPPDPEQDVFAAVKYEREQRAALEAKIANREQQEREAAQYQDFEAKVDTFWKQDVQQYATANPDFRPAATWLAEARDRQLQGTAVADPRMRDPQWRNYVIDSELKQIIVAAAQQQRSPAEMVYEIAKSWGYTPKQAAAAASMPENLARVEKAQEASRTVGATSGSAGGDALSLDAMLNMPRDEFERAYNSDKAFARKFDRALSGRD